MLMDLIDGNKQPKAMYIVPNHSWHSSTLHYLEDFISFDKSVQHEAEGPPLSRNEVKLEAVLMFRRQKNRYDQVVQSAMDD